MINILIVETQIKHGMNGYLGDRTLMYHMSAQSIYRKMVRESATPDGKQNIQVVHFVMIRMPRVEKSATI